MSAPTHTAADMAYHAWAADSAAGRDSILLAPTNDLVAELNERARLDRLAHTPKPPRQHRDRGHRHPGRRPDRLSRRLDRHPQKRPLATHRRNAAHGSKTATAGSSAPSTTTAH